MFPSRYLSCPECGASVERVQSDLHRCDPERLLDFRMFGLREEIDTFDLRLTAFLNSPHGQFQRWLAERDVRGATG